MSVLHHHRFAQLLDTSKTGLRLKPGVYDKHTKELLACQLKFENEKKAL